VTKATATDAGSSMVLGQGIYEDEILKRNQIRSFHGNSKGKSEPNEHVVTNHPECPKKRGSITDHFRRALIMTVCNSDCDLF
jgi:hypothetical protein